MSANSVKPDYYPNGTTCLLDILKKARVGETKRLLYQENSFPGSRMNSTERCSTPLLLTKSGHIGKEHLDILADFLSGHDMESGQMTLGFWAYDFRFIPVETISAIYEEFMKDANLKKKRKDGAYYTPRHLAETTLHLALEGRYAQARHWRALDPACGSGIFLVAMFNLIAEQWSEKILPATNKPRRRHCWISFRSRFAESIQILTHAASPLSASISHSLRNCSQWMWRSSRKR